MQEQPVNRQQGFTLVEILVTMLVFSMVSTAFYQVLFSGSEGSQTTRSIVRISDEARAGLNRMIRDTRQAVALTSATATGYSIEVDFNGDGVIVANVGVPNPAGDYEKLSFVVVGGTLYIEACDAANLDCGNQKSVLVDGVAQVGSTPYFFYTSHRLEYDCNNNGQSSYEELTQNAAGGGGCYVPGGLTQAVALSLLTDVDYSIRVTSDGRSSNFLSHAQMRNLR